MHNAINIEKIKTPNWHNDCAFEGSIIKLCVELEFHRRFNIYNYLPYHWKWWKNGFYVLIQISMLNVGVICLFRVSRFPLQNKGRDYQENRFVNKILHKIIFSPTLYVEFIPHFSLDFLFLLSWNLWISQEIQRNTTNIDIIQRLEPRDFAPNWNEGAMAPVLLYSNVSMYSPPASLEALQYHLPELRGRPQYHLPELPQWNAPCAVAIANFTGHSGAGRADCLKEM